MTVWLRDADGPGRGGRAPRGGAPGGRADRPPPARPPLPDEVLGAEVGDGNLFVDRMDEWRRASGRTHAQFAAYLGMSRNYWWLLRTHQRQLTIGVAQRVLRERPEFAHYLAAAIRDRSWGHSPEGG